ncbi:cytochrome bc1 complex cytochrome b subunit [Leucobacter aridicollis]|uniref:cytochrome bc1 complex cytochrome b subunit n=1 Tax=Leucobacter aridicollis TaxID=283878 RepID=UPI0021678CC4|nr:ubiquinol-cytochrome c reductase cytochrome b subunit [Leucobacter aridicollis]
MRSAKGAAAARGVTGWLADSLDSRTRIGSAVKELGRKIFPDHWSFLLGEVALYSFIVILISGTFLSLFFQASMAPVEYQGAYVPLKGFEMSAAMASTMDISFSIRGGLLMRQVHHWAALLFIASIGLHMLRVFFTGAFRKPRELNWIIGFILFVLAMAAGFTGYSLPDDTLSGNGLRIADGTLKAIPVVGTYASSLLFGGEFPGDDIVGRLYALHIMVIPAAILGLIALHLMFVVLHKHTHYPTAGRTESNVVGLPVLPAYAAKAGGFFFIVFGVIVAIASFLGINAIWLYGPYDPSPVSAGTQPDWYIGFVDGILRLVPPGWETELFGYTFSWNILVPVAVVGIFLLAVVLYPFIEAWILRDKSEHHLLQRPRNAPVRTALGVAGMAFYAVLWIAASSDILATHFQLSIEDVIRTLQILLVLGPIIAFSVTRRICLALRRKDRSILLHGRETGRIVRLPGGDFREVHADVDVYETWRLVDHTNYQLIDSLAGGDSAPQSRLNRARNWISRQFLEDRFIIDETLQSMEDEAPDS